VYKVAEVVHAADIEGELEKAPEAVGIKALLSGLRFMTENDYETLEMGVNIWEALYTYFKLKDLEIKHKEELKKMSRMERLRFLKKLIKS